MELYVAALNDPASVTTPLALAATALTLLFGVIKPLLTKTSRGGAKLIVHYGFVLALTLSLFANATYLVVQWFNQEIRVSGTIRDPDGAHLANVIIDIPGRGRGITDNYGEFQFSIPASRSADSYTIYANLDGYHSESVGLTGRRPDPINLQLKPNSISDKPPVSLQRQAYLGHYLGQPLIDAAMVLQNETRDAIRIENISLQVFSPDGHATILPMLGLHLSQFGLNPPMTSLELKPKESMTWYPEFGLFDSAMSGLESVNKEFMVRSQSETPDPAIVRYKPETVAVLSTYMESHFIWSPGDWHVTIEAFIGGRQFSSSYSMRISEDDVRVLKGMQKLYPSGIGVVSMWNSWKSLTAASHVQVELR